MFKTEGRPGFPATDLMARSAEVWQQWVQALQGLLAAAAPS